MSLEVAIMKSFVGSNGGVSSCLHDLNEPKNRKKEWKPTSTNDVQTHSL